jgi:tetratricopeptide (TPR) repeat protein
MDICFSCPAVVQILEAIPTERKLVSQHGKPLFPKAIEVIERAIGAYNAGEHKKALDLYRDALGRFVLGMECLEDECLKKFVSELVQNCTRRTDELLTHLSQLNHIMDGVKKAIEANNSGELKRALALYKKALRHQRMKRFPITLPVRFSNS